MVDDPFGPTAQLVGAHLNAPPPVQAFNRLFLGSVLLTACIYVLMWSQLFFGGAPAVIIHRNPVIALIWAALAALSVLWIVAGVRGPSLPRRGMAAFWAAVRAVLFICAIRLEWWFPLSWGGSVMAIDMAIRGIYISLLVGSAVELYAALRGPQGDAAEKMRVHLGQNQMPFRPARRD